MTIIDPKSVEQDSFLAGSRFYLQYGGSAPTAANCATLAADIAGIWETTIAPNINAEWTLVQVDVLDIATDAGAFGTWQGTNAGTGSGAGVQAQVAINVEYTLSRRYRGGKPRTFWPGGSSSQLADAAHWLDSFVTSFNTAVTGFYNAIEALSIGAMGGLNHVNVSYYQSFKNVTNSSGRTRAAPTYRTVALVDNITGYAVKAKVGSQRRRRTATTY